MIGERRKLPPKTCWVTYGLQELSTEKFLKVVQNVLDGKVTLLKPAEIKFEERDEDICSLMELEFSGQMRRRPQDKVITREDYSLSVSL
jgi:hypothetical protein